MYFLKKRDPPLIDPFTLPGFSIDIFLFVHSFSPIFLDLPRPIYKFRHKGFILDDSPLASMFSPPPERRTGWSMSWTLILVTAN